MEERKATLCALACPNTERTNSGKEYRNLPVNVWRRTTGGVEL